MKDNMDLEELAKLLMQSERIPASVELLKLFAEVNRTKGAIACLERLDTMLDELGIKKIT
jgi:hypothetical protein